MVKSNKVAWMESQYLYPHHFQQQERYVESFVDQRVRHIKPYIWGFSELTIDHSLLSTGRIGISSANGIMPDGTPFSMPNGALLPKSVELDQLSKNLLIYLVLPAYQAGLKFVETDPEHKGDSIARYKMQQIDVFDYCSENTNSEPVESAVLQFRITHGDEALGGCTGLPIARVLEITQEGTVILDDDYIPPCLHIKAHSYLQNYLLDVIGLLAQRGEALSHRFSSGTQEGGSSAIADFMLLQLVNRFEPRFKHLNLAQGLHPETLFLELLGLMGELSTFTTKQKRPLSFIPYDHDNLSLCYKELMSNISGHLSAVLEQTAMPLPVEDRQYGIRVSRIDDRSLMTQARFVIAIKANMPTDKLRSHLPNHMKIGSVESIRDLVNNQLTGITLNPLPVAPREIPYHAGFVYFELNNQGDQWESLKSSGGFAFHIAGDLTDIKVEFWAIRS